MSQAKSDSMSMEYTKYNTCQHNTSEICIY